MTYKLNRLANLLDRKINNGRIFLQKECIFCKTFDIEYDKWWQFCDFKTLHKTVFVRFIFLFRDPIKLCEQLI